MNIDIEKLLDEADLLIGSYMYDQAITKYNYILKQVSDCDEALLMRGALLGQMGQIDKAITDIEKSIRLNDKNDSAFATLAYLYERKEDDQKALELCRNAISLDSNNKDAINLLVQICKRLGDEMLSKSMLDEADDFYRSALKYQKNDTGLLYKMVLVARGKGRIENSIKLAESVINIDPNHIRAKAHIASSYELIGNTEKGNQLIEALFHDYPDHPLVNIIFAQYALRSNKQEEGISALSRILHRHDIQEYDLISINMFLGKLYDSIGEYKSAFKYIKRANDMLADDYDPRTYQYYISELINYFSKEKYSSIPESDNTSDELIFIMGMPRSGTSLIEQIISSHSSVFGAGELANVQNIANSLQANERLLNNYPACLDEVSTNIMNKLADQLISDTRKENTDSIKIIDKLPHNFHYIGLIHKLLPNAKLINCTRDARDTCLSCYFQYFTGYHPYSNNLRALGIHYLEYERLMSHWTKELNIPVLTISYEDIVSDTRNEVERILNYIDLDWEEQCMEFYKQKRQVATASYNQVNKQIYSSSIGRWKNYKNDISELLDVLSARIQ
jgi:tetratricopeptide (TPR) repeat protein